MQASDTTVAAAGTPSDYLSTTEFTSLPLHPTLLRALAELGYNRCTPIQAQSLPRALAGEDIAGQAQTGTGKTAAFLLATLNHLLTVAPEGPDGQPRAFILAPTRELAIQIHEDALSLGRFTGLRLNVVYGGTGYETQRQTLEAGTDVLIGTPGRLIDYYKQHIYTLKHVEVLVLDEADRMFDLGFIADIRYLMRRMPPAEARQNFLFSATLSNRVLELAYEHMNSPHRVEIHPEQVTADRVKQSLIHVANDDKLAVLVGLLRQEQPNRAIIFVNTKRAGELVEAGLIANGFTAAVLSGDVRQSKRERLLEDLKEGKLPMLVATDVAARGLHIPDVTHVINYDLPQDPEDYVHRIGRTARAGESGTAISLCCETYVYSLPDIEKLIGEKIPAQHDASSLIAPDFIKPKRPPRRHDGRGGPGHGRRPASGHGGHGRR
ncbi:MAG: DEAD/DEAH box helicase [Nevskiaceae bacterium]|nr:MAG: DEAD/DEAH box helicase [Nevskiaceae bacterium]TBR74259.1 MAG: DEAD/DEAH box helicase [Nevskiaceae bacterium]